MTDNTLLDAEDELDLRKWLKNNGWLWEESHVVTPECLDELQAFLRSDRKKHELQARENAIEDVKYAGYGYDDGTGFVLKISYKELETLKEQKEEL